MTFKPMKTSAVENSGVQKKLGLQKIRVTEKLGLQKN